MSDDDRPDLTNRQGHPVYDNQNLRSVGERGPATLENYHYIEKISHFDRERVPERVVHARGTTAFGVFEATGKCGGEPIAKFTRAKLFQEAGKETPLAVRFSTVAGGRDSSEAARDPRGFAIKFYTEDGNWDLVGNNLGVFFIRDAMKFPDFIHSQKPDPVTFRQEPERIFDFWASSPEALHTVTLLFSPRGIPASYRHQQGFGVNTYKWVNAEGETVLIKYHWLPKQPVRSWTSADAAAVQAEDLGPHTKDLRDAIEAGDFPQWDLHVQMMSDEEHPELGFDPLDDTKVWPEQDFPLHHVGTMTLNRNVSDFFTESEQIAFGTGVLVDGMDFSDDKMLVGRTFSYSDTQRYRVGPNYLQLPVNRPRADVRTNQDGGPMAYGTDDRGANPHVNYEPSYQHGLLEAPRPPHVGPVYSGRLVRGRIPQPNDYQQPGERYRLQDDWERDELVANLVDKLSGVSRPLQERMVWHFLMCDSDYGKRVGEGIGVSVEDVKDLDPLPSQELTPAEEAWRQNLGANPPRDVSGLVMTHCVPNERDVRVAQDGSGNGRAAGNGAAEPARA